jgi:type VI secretion system protein ImpK
MRLSDFFMPLVAFVRSFENANANTPQEVAQTLDAMIQQARTEAVNANVNVELFQQGLFPIAAWADERIARLKVWQTPMAWQPHLLQRRYFKTSLAGREFFERLEVLGHDDAPVRELYLLCLCMGFIGRYANPSDAGILSSLKLEQYRQILEVMGVSGDAGSLPIFPSAYSAETKAKQSRTQRLLNWPKLRTVAFIVIPILIMIGVALVLNSELDQSVRHFRSSVNL